METKKRIYKKIAKGVYKESTNTYRVRKMINGKSTSVYFTNKTKAIKFYKSL